MAATDRAWTGRQQAASKKRRAGQETRRAVLGDEHVDRARPDDAWTGAMQSIAEEFCWGEIWTRPGLSRRDRSLITIAMLIALDRPTELALHVAGAVRNGCTRGEVLEVVLHSSVYCGCPAASAAMELAAESLTEMGV
jgi:4-carboxymuconolactone decarboxylase